MKKYENFVAAFENLKDIYDYEVERMGIITKIKNFMKFRL